MGSKKPRWTARERKAAAILRRREESAKFERKRLGRVGILPPHLAEIANTPPKQYIKGDNAPRPRRYMTDKERRLNTTARRKRRPYNIPFNPAYMDDRNAPPPPVPDVLAGRVKVAV